jgi:hypothetical protein
MTVSENQTQAYVTVAQSATGRSLYNVLVVDARGRRNAPLNIRRHTLENVLSMAMSYAREKGLPFRLVASSDLLAEAAAVSSELATRYGIRVAVEVA